MDTHYVYIKRTKVDDMSKHIGQIKDRLTLQVKYLYSAEWTQTAFGGYGTDYWYRHIFKDMDGNTLTWKTIYPLGIEGVDDKGYGFFKGVTKGSLITIKGTVKAHTEYNEEAQTEINRVKVITIDELAPTYEEIQEAKKQAQLDTLKDGDVVIHMLYSNYKKHYSDCETVIDSYNGKHRTINVIVRAGRLKASGVRGEHFSGYELTNELGKKTTYRAVSEENALKRAAKEHPEHTWECTKIYDYRSMR